MEETVVVQDLYTPEQLNQMHQQLWQCVLKFANLSATQERNRIARDLHDSLGHALTALNFQVQTAMKLCQPEAIQAQASLNEAHRLVTIATQEMRESVRALRDEAIETQSFETLLAALVQDFYQTTQIQPTIAGTLHLPEHLKTPVYRLIQEALNNVRKYAQATAVQICLELHSDSLHLTIQDNGRGFNQNEIAGGYGLRGMRERVEVLQGHLTIDSDSGCSIRAKIPLSLMSISPYTIEISEWHPLSLNYWHL